MSINRRSACGVAILICLKGYFDVSLTTSALGRELVLDLESQLGLTLLEGKRPVPVLAIKDIKKPVED